MLRPGASGFATTATAQTLVPRFELVGFTSGTSTGDLGGIFAATQLCQAEFPGSRICSDREIIDTVNLPTGLSGSAWVGRFSLSGTNLVSCDSFTTSGSNFSTMAVTSGGHLLLGTTCSFNRRLACCAPTPPGSGDLNADGVVNILDSVILRRLIAGLPIG